MDDNITAFKGVRTDLYPNDWLPTQTKGFPRDVFQHLISGDQLATRLDEEKLYCQGVGAHYAGFATTTNPYFLAKKRRVVGYVISKMAIIHNTGLAYDTRLEAMEDYGFCARHLEKYGVVSINNWMWPVARHYQPGGIGTYQQRLPRKVSDCRLLMQMYPGLFRYKLKAYGHPKGELQMRLTSRAQVEKWRKALPAARAQQAVHAQKK